MAGLMNTTAMTPPAVAMAPDPGGLSMGGMDGGGGDDGTVSASPEEQREYEAFVVEGMGLIYTSGKIRPGLLKLLDDDPRDLIQTFGENELFAAENFTPVVALAATAATVVLELVATAKEKPSGDIIMHGGQELLEQLAEVVESTGIHTYSDEEMSQAWMIGMELYRITGGHLGIYDPADAEADAEELRQAGAEGRTFDVLPQLRPFVGGEA